MAIIEIIVTDMGNGCACCSNCGTNLDNGDPFAKIPFICPKCGETFTDRSTLAGPSVTTACGSRSMRTNRRDRQNETKNDGSVLARTSTTRRQPSGTRFFELHGGKGKKRSTYINMGESDY